MFILLPKFLTFHYPLLTSTSLRLLYCSIIAASVLYFMSRSRHGKCPTKASFLFLLYLFYIYALLQ